MQEFRVYSAVQHPNILRATQLFRTPTGACALALEYASQGDLFDHIASTSTNPDKLWNFFSQMVCAFVAAARP